MDIRIYKGTAYGTITAPPSKSYGHRMLICAALSEGESVIEGISSSEDMLATAECIRALGAFAENQGSIYRISGIAPSSAPGTFPVFNCRESGSTLRFFIPISMALTGGGVFRGTERLIERGIGVYEELFLPLGIKIDKRADSITINGKLRPGDYHVRGDVSSQFISGLMFALPLLDGDSIVHVIPPVESRAYIDITLNSMKLFGIEINEISENTFLIRGGQHYRASSAQVEGDWSNASFLYAIRDLASSGRLEINGLRSDSLQGDRICLELFEKLRSKAEEAIDISGCPDLGPVLFSYAAAVGGGRFTGTQRLKIKESDRGAVMAEELSKFGIQTRISENSIEILPGKLAAPNEILNGHNDHRVVMALAVLMLLTGGIISGAEAVNKSYPGFFDDLNRMGIRTEILGR